MRTNFKLLTRLFVDVRASQNCVPANLRRQWNRSCDSGTRSLWTLDDINGWLVQQSMIVAFEANTYLLALHAHKPRCVLFLFMLIRKVGVIASKWGEMALACSNACLPERITCLCNTSVAVKTIRGFSQKTLKLGRSASASYFERRPLVAPKVLANISRSLIRSRVKYLFLFGKITKNESSRR